MPRPGGWTVPFTVRCEGGDNETVEVINGEVDVATAPQMAEVASRAVGIGIDPVVFDLRGVTYFDSSGMGVLVQTARDLHVARRPGPRVRSATGFVRIALQTVGLGFMLDD